MKNEINYIDIINLGFKEEVCDDKAYFNQYGYEYVIITKQLTKFIYLDWAKETRICKMIRVDKDSKIKAEINIGGLESLIEIITFFTK